MTNPSPICTVNSTATTNGVDVTASSTVTIALADSSGVSQWNLTCLTTDELGSAATINGTLVVNLIAKTATFTAPGLGSACIFQSKVNNGIDSNGVAQASYTTTFKVSVKTSTLLRVAAFNETTENNAATGWVGLFNNLVRNYTGSTASAGAGLVFGSGAYAVGQNADGSIVVNADDIQLKAAYQTLLNGATASATATTLALRNGSGGISFAAVSATSVAASAGVTVGTTLGVTGAATVGGTLGVTGTSTLGVVNAGSSTAFSMSISTTLGVTGAATLSSTVAMAGAATLGSTLTFLTGVSTPTISQADNTTNSATAQVLTLQAQNATGTTSFGGGMVLAGGTGTTGSGIVTIKNGATTNTIFGLAAVTFSRQTIAFDTAVTTPAINQVDNTTNSATAQNLTVQAQNATGTTAVGGNLVLVSGTGTSTTGSVQVKAGATLVSTYSTTGVVHNQTTMQFATGVSAPRISQADNTTNSASGTSLTIQAQNATGTSAIGGNLILQSGTGTNHGGSVSIVMGSTTMVQATSIGLGFYGVPTVAQASRAGQLTDSTGGSVTSTLAAGITDTVAKNAIASLAAKVNALELMLHNVGISA